MAGFADFVGILHPTDVEKQDMAQKLLDHTKYLFPEMKWEKIGTPWIGFRPMTPDNFPYVGKDLHWKKLYLNCGHGSNGWTTSAGTSSFLAQSVRLSGA